MILLFLSQIHRIRTYLLSRKKNKKKKWDNGTEEQYFVEPCLGEQHGRQVLGEQEGTSPPQEERS